MAFTQTAVFKNYLKEKIIQTVNSQTNLNISIEKLEGNLYQTLRLKNVELLLNDTLFASFSSLSAEYDILALRSHQIILNTIILETPKINCIHYSDSTWNFQHILIPDKKDSLNRKNQEFNFEINIPFISIRKGLVAVHSFIDLLPQKITDINLDLNGFYKTGVLEFHLQNMNFKTQNPTFKIDTASIDLRKDETGIYLHNFLFRTPKSNIITRGFYKVDMTLNAGLSANKMDKDDFKLFVPKFNLRCSPEINSSIISVNDSTRIWLELTNNNQKIKVEAGIYHLNKVLHGEKAALSHLTLLKFINVVPEQWIELPATNLIVNGEVKLSGKNLLDFNSPVFVKADLKNLDYSGEKIDKLLIDGFYTADLINSSVELQTVKGNATIKGSVKNIFSFPEFQFLAATKSFSLSAFLPEMEDSYIAGKIDVSGNGFNLSNLAINGTIYLENSKLYHVQVDSAVANLKYANNSLEMNAMNLFIDGGWLEGTGNYDLKTKKITSELHSEVDSLTALNYFLRLPVQFKSLKADANISGQANDFLLSGSGKILNANGYSNLAETINASFNGRIKTDSILINLLLNSYKLENNFGRCDSVKTDIKYFNNTLNSAIKVSFEDSLSAVINARTVLGDTIEINIDSFQVNTPFSQYYMNNKSQTFHVNKNDIHIQNLWIKDRLNPAFVLKLNGNLSVEKNNELSLLVKNLDLQKFNRFLSLTDSIKGTVYSEINISGPIQNPTANIVANLSKPEYGPLALSEITGKITLKDKLIDAQIAIPEIGNGVFASVKIPLAIYNDSTGFIVQQPDSFNAEITIDSLLFSQIYNNSSLPNISISGVLNSKIQASGNFRNPQFFGNIYLKDGNIADDVLGISYNKINASIGLNGSKINLDSFLIKQKEGFLILKGNVEFDSSLVSEKIVNTSVTVDASNFTVLKNRQHELQIDAKTFLNTGEKNQEFGGEIKIIQSNFNLNELSPKMAKNDETDIPLLVQSITKQGDSHVEDEKEQFIENTVEKQRSSILKDITGRLHVLIPHNTWIKSENMNMELKGDFDLVKTGPFFEIFGTIAINRGNYIIYGKKLSIKEGNITFRGGEKIDPEINLKADLTFKGTDKVSHILELFVTDNILDPTITFTLDKNSISETEAMTILVFGKTSEELALSGQGSMVSSLGAGKLAQILTSQLTKTLGSTLNLDLVEVASTDNWQTASFVIGKYITNDLFVTYQRGFGETEGDEITPRKVSLEYKLKRFLFLQLQSGTSKSSGLDIILKFEHQKR